MNIGQKVKIKGTNSVWDGKEGILEDVNEDTCTVFVDFIPGEHKRVRQDFNIDNIDFGGYSNSEVQDMHEDLDLREDDYEEEGMTSKIIKALAEHFGVDEDEIEVSTWGGGHNFIVNGEEYWVGTYDEAYDEAVAMAKSNLDDMGLEALAPDYKDYAIRNFGDEDKVEEWMRDSYQSYIDDIEGESDSEFESRLVSEMYDADILTDEDFEEFDGEPDHSTLKDSVNFEDKKEAFLDNLCEQDAIQWLFDNFGDEEASKMLVDNNAIDFDKVAEDCVDTDGVAHFVADYDGDEIELADNLYAYRRG